MSTEIDYLINRLESERRIWKEQVGLPGSNMKSKDIAFLDRQIAKLSKLKDRVADELVGVAHEVDRYIRNF